MLKARIRGVSLPAPVQEVLDPRRGSPLSFLVESGVRHMFPASRRAPQRSRKGPEFYLPVSFLNLTHKYVVPCTGPGENK